MLMNFHTLSEYIFEITNLIKKFIRFELLLIMLRNMNKNILYMNNIIIIIVMNFIFKRFCKMYEFSCIKVSEYSNILRANV